MAYLSTNFAGWLMGSLLIGLASGWISVVFRGAVLAGKPALGAAGVAAVLVVLSVLHLVPGRPGYWLDLLLVMTLAYLTGCAIGSALRFWVVSRQSRAAAD
jgi:hypothetical protein